MIGNRGVTGGFGTTGTPVYVGVTGGIGSIGSTGMGFLTCCVCKKFSSMYWYFDIDFEIIDSSKGYRVCKKCLKRTEKLLKVFKKMEIDLLPMHINHYNIFVKEVVKNRLRAGI